MTRSILKLAALSLALSSAAADASAQGLFNWGRSDKAAPAAPVADKNTADTGPDGVPADLNTAIIRAQLSRRIGNFADATKILSQLVLFAPDDPRVIGEYGKTLAAQGKSDDALAFLERAVQLQPNEWSFYSALGVAHDQKGEYPLAQSAYQRALALKPGEPSVLNNAALSYLQSGDLETAERMARDAAATSTDKGRVQQTVALVERIKSTRPAVARAPRAPEAPAAAPQADYLEPAQLASVAPAETPTADRGPAQLSTPPESPFTDAPITSSELPPLEDESVDLSIEITPPVPAPTIASLQSDPTVRMQAVPKDDLAGPVHTPAPKAEAQIAQKAPAAAAPRKQLSVSANPPLTTKPAQTASVSKPEPHAYYVQAGAFATEDRADKLAASLDTMGARVSPTIVGGRSLYRVRIGPFKDAQQANDALGMAKSLGHTDVKVVAE
jgi:Flp pilus assembly protein TadD